MITDKEKFIEKIKTYSSLQSLINGIILSGRCSFFILSSKTPLSTNAALEYIQTAVENANQAPLKLQIFRPDYKSDYGEMIEAMVLPLLELATGDFGHTLYTLDFTSFADKLDETAIVFQRLNEMRNTLITRLDGSLLVVLPFGMEREFAIRAPDMWSIRSGVCMMDEALYGANIDMPIYSKNTKADTKTLHTKNDIAKLSDEVASLRELYRTSPTRNVGRGLLIALDRYGAYALEYSNIKEAQSLYEEFLDMAQKIVEQNPDNIEAQRDLAIGLSKIGDVYLKTGEAAKAKEAYEDSLSIRTKMAEQNPDSLQAQRDLAIGLSKIGDVYLKTGEAAKAKEAYEDSLKIAQKIVEQNPDSVEAQRDLSISLERIGYIYLETEDVTKAKEAYEDSLKIAQKIAEQNPDNLQAQRDLAISLSKIGDVYLKTGEAAKAKEAYEDSLSIRAKIVEQNPDSVEAQRDLAVSYAKLASTHEMLGDNAKALYYRRSCAEILSPAVETFGDIDGMSAMLEYCNMSIERLSAISK